MKGSITLMKGSTCFGQHYAHHQELTNISLITTWTAWFFKDGGYLINFFLILWPWNSVIGNRWSMPHHITFLLLCFSYRTFSCNYNISQLVNLIKQNIWQILSRACSGAGVPSSGRYRTPRLMCWACIPLVWRINVWHELHFIKRIISCIQRVPCSILIVSC
jgi:hypothetical protein